MSRKQQIISGLCFYAFVGGLVALLTWPWTGEAARCQSCKEEKRFKIMELWPGRARGCGGSHKNTCISNLRQIDGAKATWALEFKKNDSDVPTTNNLFGTTAYIRDLLRCPHEGIYRLGTVAEKPTCSHAGHTL